MEERDDPRAAVRERLEADLDVVEERDVRSAVFCGEMGCDEREQEYLIRHPNLRCPYVDRVDEPRTHCMRLRETYQAAITR